MKCARKSDTHLAGPLVLYTHTHCAVWPMIAFNSYRIVAFGQLKIVGGVSGEPCRFQLFLGQRSNITTMTIEHSSNISLNFALPNTANVNDFIFPENLQLIFSFYLNEALICVFDISMIQLLCFVFAFLFDNNEHEPQSLCAQFVL